MPGNGLREVEHDIEIAADGPAVYRLLADVGGWPQLFPPTIHAEHLERGDGHERIRLWATANGAVKSWTSRRALDPGRLRIEFQQEVSSPPVAAMGGTWIVEAIAPGRCRVRLLHTYRAVGDDPAGLEWIATAVDRNSRSELAALRTGAELEQSGLMLSFEDSVRVDGSARDVYDFLNQAQYWPERLPHVAKVDLTEEVPGLQTLSMDTRTKDGATHTTTSVRVCFPHRRIVYKQIVLPALMRLHTGFWQLDEDGSGTTAKSQHTVILNPENITRVLGPDAGVEQARAFVRTALSGNSTATLNRAREFAEQARRLIGNQI